MTILHLLSQNQLTGAEVYACQLAEQQIAQGHQVYQVSNGFYYPTEAQKIALPVENRNRILFLKNAAKLRKILIEHKVQVVHAHSNAAAKMAAQATRGTKIGFITTVHGRQHWSWSKRLFRRFGCYCVAVCENVADQLKSEFCYSPHDIKLIRNGVDSKAYFFNKIQPIKTKSDVLKIGVIGRFTGPKKTRTVEFVRHFGDLLKKKDLPFEMHVAVPEKAAVDLRAGQEVILHLGQSELNAAFYQQFDLVVGSGRVCMEALMSGVPVIAYGEAEYLGLCQKQNFKVFLQSNFGDISSSPNAKPKFKPEIAQRDLDAYFEFNPNELSDLALLAHDEFNLKSIAEQIQKVYEAAYFCSHHPHWIPVLMYHKVPDQPLNSPHKIFVTKDKFRQHLDFFKKQGFITLTFSDLKKFKSGERPFTDFPHKPLILTFDDGYVDNLRNAAPLLREHGFKAQVFLLAKTEITHNEWDEKDPNKGDAIVMAAERQAWRNSPFEIGSHGLGHARMTELTKEQAYHELVESKTALERELGQSICAFAYPYGDSEAIHARLARLAGYEFAVNTDRGGINLLDDPYQIFRVSMFPNESTFSLWKKTSRWYRRYYLWKRGR